MIVRTFYLSAASLMSVCSLLPVVASAQDALEIIELDPIVVTAAGVPVDAFDAPASVTVITGEELERQGASDLSDIVSYTPGVSVAGAGDSAQIYIRGVPSEYALLLIDGKRLNSRASRQSNSGGVDQYYMPPVSAIERIEIVRGPMSSLYGSDAVGGVINIITKPVSPEWTGSITFESSFAKNDEDSEDKQASFYLSGPLVGDKLGLQLWGRRLDRSGSTRMENGRYVGVDSRDLRELGARLTYVPVDGQKFTFDLSKTDNTSESQDGDISEWPRRSASLGYEGYIGGWDVFSSLYYEQAETNLSASRTDRRPEVETTIFDLKGARWFEWYGSHELTVGMQIQESEITDQNLGTGSLDHLNFSNTQSAVFVEDIWSPNDRLNLTFGARYTDDEYYGGDFTPRAYALYDLSANWKLAGGIATGFKAPDIREATPDYLTCTSSGCRSVAPGNPDLKPEESTNYEIGVRFLNETSSFNATIFQTDYRNRISTRDTGTTMMIGGTSVPVDEWYNIDKARVQGLELAGTHFLTSDLEISGNYTHTKSEQLSGANEGEPLSRSPEHQASLRLDWQTPVDGLDAWVSAQYFGSSTNVSSRTNPDLASYTTVNLGAVYKLNDTVSLKGAINNVADTEITFTDHGVAENGRTFWLALTTEF